MRRLGPVFSLIVLLGLAAWVLLPAGDTAASCTCTAQDFNNFWNCCEIFCSSSGGCLTHVGNWVWYDDDGYCHRMQKYQCTWGGYYSWECGTACGLPGGSGSPIFAKPDPHQT